MPQIVMTFSSENNINHSLEEGDIAYYVTPSVTVGGFETHPSGAELVKIGVVQNIQAIYGVNTGQFNSFTVLCEIGEFTTPPQQDVDFIFFAKNRTVNEASILGYYSKMKFENNDYTPAEIFAAACDVSENSK
tara:strand:+ start:15419 stop:15817 length:399 start_codon:yes stop_codon:yes gene_type:complete